MQKDKLQQQPQKTKKLFLLCIINTFYLTWNKTFSLFLIVAKYHIHSGLAFSIKCSPKDLRTS